jgi:hypothetical protein
MTLDATQNPTIPAHDDTNLDTVESCSLCLILPSSAGRVVVYLKQFLANLCHVQKCYLKRSEPTETISMRLDRKTPKQHLEGD